MIEHGGDTSDAAYTQRLVSHSDARWKQVLDVQAPYRWNLRRLFDGRAVLDVGCGIGRHLAHLPPGSVGVDHNPTSIDACRAAGLPAFTVDEFTARDTGLFDGLLAAHLVEHLPAGSGAAVLAGYVERLAPGAVVVLICPQERGYASDATHVAFQDQDALGELAGALGLRVQRQYSFPLPRSCGRWFTHNEFVTVATVPER